MFGFQGGINSGNEEEITRPRLDSARAGEKQIGKGIADSANTQLIPRFFFPEEVNHVEHLAALLFGTV